MTADVAWLAWPGVAVAACGIATLVLARRASRPTVVGLGLLTLLAAFFLAFVALAPVAAGRSVVSTSLFLGALAVFKLMNRFELR